MFDWITFSGNKIVFNPTSYLHLGSHSFNFNSYNPDYTDQIDFKVLFYECAEFLYTEMPDPSDSYGFQSTGSYEPSRAVSDLDGTL